MSRKLVGRAGGTGIGGYIVRKEFDLTVYDRRCSVESCQCFVLLFPGKWIIGFKSPSTLLRASQPLSSRML